MSSKRPFPPKNMPEFAPAPDVFQWVKATMLNSESKIYNPDHGHLNQIEMPELSFLWANGGFVKAGRVVLGQCEKVVFRIGGWQKQRQEQQMIDWFGDIPNFLITLDAQFCRDCSDLDFCALIDHELYHIAHAKDKYGGPAFDRDTGKPKLAIQGHDVEEFIGVVRRYGAHGDVKRMVEAANKKPELSSLSISQSCGTCILKIA